MNKKIKWFEEYFPKLLKKPVETGIREAMSLFQNAKDDEERGIALFAKGLLLRFKFRFDEALSSYKTAQNYFEISDSPEWIAALNHGIGHVYDAQGKVSDAEPYYILAYNYYHKNKILKREAMICVNISQLYVKRSESKKTLIWLNKAYRIFSRLNDKHALALTLNNIAGIYNSEGEYKKAANFYKACINVFMKLKDYDKVVGNYTNIGSVCISLKKYKEAEKNLLAAKKYINEKTEPYIAANADINLGRVYSVLKPHLAEEYLYSASKVCRSINDNSLLSKTLLVLGQHFHKTKDIERAKKFYLKASAIQKKFGYRKDLVEVNEMISRIFQQQKNLPEALKHCREAHKVYSEIYNENAFNEISSLKSEIEKQKAENEAEAHRLRALELKRELESKTRELNLMANYLVKKNDFVSGMMSNVNRFVKDMDIETPDKTRLNEFLKVVESNSKLSKDVMSFEENLNRINLAFTDKLSRKFRTLSPIELKICSLLKINLSTKEIAKLLFISYRTVENHRHRIILKLKLPHGRSLTEFINSI
ncbi:MAG: tetratricopeptide repeat protein [Ignavibacteria bacterium]|nr:tetratricopeptide repeat protein [Ignavibacteria bacterium]